MRDLYTIPEGIETRWASPENPTGGKGRGGSTNGGRKGTPYIPLAHGGVLVLGETSGRSGMVRRIWLTCTDRSQLALRSLRLDMFWDGASEPAVSVPLGDFFGAGLSQSVRLHSRFFANPEGRSYVSYLPMPFKTGMKIVLTNEGPDQSHIFWDIDFTLGDEFGPDSLYLHALWRREAPTSIRRDFEIVPGVRGRGRYLGAVFGVIADQRASFGAWWGEGEVKAFIDGDASLPTLCGTGTEDYIGTAWCQGKYDHLDQGCPVADHEALRFAFYRFHALDPVWFHRDLRVTIQQIGCWDPMTKARFHHAERDVLGAGASEQPQDLSLAGKLGDHGLFERQDDWSCCAYVCLDRPGRAFAPLASVAERTAGTTTAQPPYFG